MPVVLFFFFFSLSLSLLLSFLVPRPCRSLVFTQLYRILIIILSSLRSTLLLLLLLLLLVLLTYLASSISIDPHPPITAVSSIPQSGRTGPRNTTHPHPCLIPLPPPPPLIIVATIKYHMRLESVNPID